MKKTDNQGFTLIEVIVVAGIIAILAGILVPLIFKEIDEAKITRAAADIKSIMNGMIVHRKDTGQWPVFDASCAATVTLLTGQGNPPAGLAAMGYDTGNSSLYDDHLSRNPNSCYNNWKGPYFAIVSPDPWGNHYMTNADAFPLKGRPVWIISAGPNGKTETPATSETLLGDDVGIRIQ
jgi:general secretion pathway protein G